MKRILVSESQYNKLIRLLNEQVFIFNNKEDEKDINPEITQTLSYLSSVLGRISNKNLYIDKVENGIVYIDSSKYTQEELDLLQSKIESYVAHNVNPKDKLIQNALGFDSGTDSDWTGEDVVVVDDEEDDGSTAEVEDDSSTAEVEDDSNTATIDDEDEKIYREVEACNFGKNSKGKRRVVILPPAMDIRFYQDILKRLGTNVTCEKMLFFFAWRDGESSESTYNPFATTYRDEKNEGCYYNCLPKAGSGNNMSFCIKPNGCRTCKEGCVGGVRNYKTYESGLNATVKSLTNGRYNNVVRKLKNDNITAIEIAEEKTELSVWGTGGLVHSILNLNNTIKVNKIAKYGGNSIVEEDCSLTTQEYNFYKKHIRSKSDGDAFRRWVNSDNVRLNNVNRKLSDCERFDGLSPAGELNDYLELAFKYKGKEWVNAGKPESENKPVVKTKNGNFSTSELMRIIDDVNGNAEYLSKAAGTQFMKMVEAAKKDGVTIKITDAYRPCGSPGDYKKYKRGEIKFTQWVAWEDYKFHRGNLAAEPVPNNEADWNSQGGGYCTSNHGWGNAIDTSGSESSKWVRKNGEKYGWFHGEASNESWHFTFCGNNVENEPRFCKNVDKSKIEASAVQTSRNDESDCPNYDCWSYFGKEDFWNGSSKINNVTVPKITISKSPTLFKITYKGKTSGFLLKHGRGGKNDTIHQLLNVLTLELNSYLKQNNLKPVIKTIKMNLSGNDLSVEVPLVNSGNKKYLIDRRGRLGGGSIDDSGLNKYKTMDGYEEASHESGNLKEKFITVITEKNVPPSDNKIGDKIIETAYTKIGEPYEWGNEFKVDKNNPDGKGGDCSGFIDWVLSNTPGISSPYNGRETSENLKNLVTPGNVGKKTGLGKGDILVFTGRIGHVAFVSKVDGGKVDMIDSGKGGVNVRTNIFNKKYWSKNYYGVIPLVNGKYESK